MTRNWLPDPYSGWYTLDERTVLYARTEDARGRGLSPGAGAWLASLFHQLGQPPLSILRASGKSEALLCPSSRENLPRRLTGRFAAKLLAEARRGSRVVSVILSFEDGEWYGRGLELPQIMDDGKTAEECVANTRRSRLSGPWPCCWSKASTRRPRGENIEGLTELHTRPGQRAADRRRETAARSGG